MRPFYFCAMGGGITALIRYLWIVRFVGFVWIDPIPRDRSTVAAFLTTTANPSIALAPHFTSRSHVRTNAGRTTLPTTIRNGWCAHNAGRINNDYYDYLYNCRRFPEPPRPENRKSFGVVEGCCGCGLNRLSLLGCYSILRRAQSRKWHRTTAIQLLSSSSSHDSPSSMSNTSFDFSSTVEWERFYQKELLQQQQQQQQKHQPGKNEEADEGKYTEMIGVPLEWHSSIPTSTLLDLIPSRTNISLSSSSTSTSESGEDNCINGTRSNRSVLVMIGCGTSDLPYHVLQRYRHTWRVVLLDSSPTCIEILQRRYRSTTSRNDGNNADNDEMGYICGDVANLNALLQKQFGQTRWNHSSPPPDQIAAAPTASAAGAMVDCVYDKGLLDALLCGEGWNGPVTTLLEQVAAVLREGGSYIVISYRLPSSTQDFLIEMGNPYGLVKWDFSPYHDNEDGHNSSTQCNPTVASPRVQVSRATKKTLH